MNAFATLRAAGVTTRSAAALTGLARATMDRATRSSSTPQSAVSRTTAAPKNKLSDVEEQRILAVLHSPEFIDQVHRPGSSRGLRHLAGAR